MRLIDNHDMTYIGDRVPVTKDVIPSWNGSTNFSFFYTNVKLWKVILSTSNFYTENRESKPLLHKNQ